MEVRFAYPGGRRGIDYRLIVGGLLTGLAFVVCPTAATASRHDEARELLARADGASLGRPTDGKSDPIGDGYSKRANVKHRCFVRGKKRSVCVHWVTRGADAPPRPLRRVPPQVSATIQVLKTVWNVEITQLGYRPPLRDRGSGAGQGPNRGLDFYLADIGEIGLTGYCLSDTRSKKPSKGGSSSAPAYCVLDDDYSDQQFSPPGESGQRALETTVAHEFFHAIQFGYELSSDDRWLDEGTATWMEQFVFDPQRVADHRYPFLSDGPLQQPEVPLDEFGPIADAQDNEYGAWVFWQFLSEYAGTPDIVRRVWEEVGRAGGGDPSTADSLRTALEGLVPDPDHCWVQCAASNFDDVFAEFEAWNVVFPERYARGAAYSAQLGARAPPPDGALVVDPGESTGARSISVARLSMRNIVLLLDDSSPVRIEVNLPDADPTASAIVQPYAGTDALAPVKIGVDAAGQGETVISGATFVRLLLVSSATTGGPRPFVYQASAP